MADLKTLLGDKYEEVVKMIHTHILNRNIFPHVNIKVLTIIIHQPVSFSGTLLQFSSVAQLCLILCNP